MPAIFSEVDKLVAAQIGVVLALVGGVVTAGVTYYCTPKYTRVGYEPVQPVLFFAQRPTRGNWC